MDRRIVAALVSILVIIGLRSAAPPSGVIPLVTIPQGISALTIGGERIFVHREGTLTLTAFRALAPSGADLSWCPAEGEEVFVSREGDLYTREGGWVFGPSKRDMDRVRLVVTDDLRVVIHPRRVTQVPRSRGEVPGETYLRFDRWLNPRSYEPPVPFCEEEVR